MLIGVLAVALTYGNMCCVSKESVTQVNIYSNLLFITDSNYLLIFYLFSAFLFSQAADVRRDSCCRTDAVCQ